MGDPGAGRVEGLQETLVRGGDGVGSGEVAGPGSEGWSPGRKSDPLRWQDLREGSVEKEKDLERGEVQ